MAEPTNEQLALIERNRQRALLKQQKKQTNLTTVEAFQLEKYDELKVSASQDTGGGFFLNNEEKSDKFSIQQQQQQPSSSKQTLDKPILLDTRENVCDECQDNFSNSFLLSTYNEKICDQCNEPKGRHRLITKTEAKSEYLLSDADLEMREPILKFLLKKNPRDYARHGYMKLYLLMQVEERALEVWGSEEKLEEERELREEKRDNRKRKKFDKEIKKMRMDARSSYYKKRLTETHEHEFGAEEPDSEADDQDDNNSDSQFSPPRDVPPSGKFSFEINPNAIPNFIANPAFEVDVSFLSSGINLSHTCL
ncbi:hypothetical protein BLOT_002375 [Blomia tropicalis]|nr:hypothetical protein BLOT_002375 [Blomia tropicalis]